MSDPKSATSAIAVKKEIDLALGADKSKGNAAENERKLPLETKATKATKPDKKKAAKKREGGESRKVKPEKAGAEQKAAASNGSAAPPGKRKKTIDETYQAKNEREHVLSRPDTQIGSTKFVTEKLWVLDLSSATETKSTAQAPQAALEAEKSDEKSADVKDGNEGSGSSPRDGKKEEVVVVVGRMVYRSCRYVPGLYKIVDEALVNATDAARQRDDVTVIKVDIDPVANSISIYNNGNGLPVAKHESGLWVPEFVFGEMRASSNGDDTDERLTGGRNGYGIKCTNIMSSKFVVDVHDAERNLHYKQTWTKNMGHKSEAKVTKREKKKSGHVHVVFYPDLAQFDGMTVLDPDILAILHRRVYDVAATRPNTRVFLNGTRIKIKSLHDYALLFQSQQPNTHNTDDDDHDDNDVRAKRKAKPSADDEMEGEGEGAVADVCAQKRAAKLAVVYECVNDRWEVCVGSSDGSGFQQMSFVNGICTSRGGRHVDLVVDQLMGPIKAALKKKSKGAAAITSQTIRNHLFVFVNASIVNPAFDSQTKNTLVTDKSKFGSTCVLSDRTIKKIVKSEIVTTLLDLMDNKFNKGLHKTDGKQRGDPKVDKLSDATATSAKDRQKCTLILTEGDSAKALAMAGLSVVGRKYYGVFALKGKPVNPRDAKLKKILGNKEFAAIKKILGLKNGERYTDTSQLRYGKIYIMADADKDGVHIVALVINIIEHYWPELLQIPGFIHNFITPIVKATKGKQVVAFYSESEYNAWKRDNVDGKPNGGGYTIKWYKGLGTNSSLEGKEYFSDLRHHAIPFRWTGTPDHLALELAFGKKNSDLRKEWLGAHKTIDPLLVAQQDHDEKHNVGQAVDPVQAARAAGHVTVSDFVNKQLILYSIANNERHISSVVDGLKHAGRKILFACFKRKLVREIKVASLAGYVIEQASYQHGEASCASTIINIAQNHVGSNNVNLLMPSGQFGSRAEAGQDSASPRYINTYLSPVARTVMVPEDDAILVHLMDEGTKIEPIYYLPILCFLLFNGCRHGIGTGWSSDIPPFNPREIAALTKLQIAGATITPETHPLHPYVKNFKGTITAHSKNPKDYCVRGVCTVSESGSGDAEIKEIVITEVPYEHGLTEYHSYLRALKSQGKIEQVLDDTTEEAIRYTVTMTAKQFVSATRKGSIHKFLKLESSINMNNLVAFNAAGQLTRYKNVHQILDEFYKFRLPFYQKRKQIILKQLTLELGRLSNRARFILMAVDEKSLSLRNKPKATIAAQLAAHKFPLLPKKKQSRPSNQDADNTDDAPDASDNNEDGDSGPEAAGGGEQSPVGKSAAELERGYDYLLGMPLWSLTMERVRELKAMEAKKAQEIEAMQKMQPSEMWTKDIDAFVAALDKHEAAELEKQTNSTKKQLLAKKSSSSSSSSKHDKKKPAIAAKRKLPAPSPSAAVPTIKISSSKKIKH